MAGTKRTLLAGAKGDGTPMIPQLFDIDNSGFGSNFHGTFIAALAGKFTLKFEAIELSCGSFPNEFPIQSFSSY